ncbi:MAG: Fic family protein [Acutalibacteraceae bacterium]|nr:Fic family protein [Acutalibacteraceae bacterium]
MDIKIFTKMLKDKHFTNYEKMKYKYGKDFNDFLKTLDDLYYKELPLCDFEDNNIVFIENHASVNQNTVKLLLQSQDKHYGIKAAEDEIVATSAIESIDFSRDSVRKILKGYAPKDEQESRILGVKNGLEFIADTSNKITEENLYKLYMMTVGDFLDGEDRLAEGNFYRHDTVYVVRDRVEHSGLDCKRVPEFMRSLIEFANNDDDINDLIKAAIIHFYIAFVHPYFDGNGRMARLVHLWFLIQKGYQSALFISFSSRIEKSRKAYYDAFTAVEQNKKYSGKIDVTPFVLYFINNVYNKMTDETTITETLTVYDNAVKDGKITEKETKLWKFVLSFYGTEEFSTKQLEKDFGNAAYATIRGFVLKFEDLGLLSSVKYGPRVKYKIIK